MQVCRCRRAYDTLSLRPGGARLFATIRRYVVEPSVVDDFAQRVDDFDELLQGVAGCSGGQLVRTREGVIVVMVGDDERVLIEAGRRFAAWSQRTIPGLAVASLPDVWAGDLLSASAAERGA